MSERKEKFTPGPWEAAGKMIRDCRVDDNRHACDFPQQGIAMCYEGRTRRKAEALANARLIAAAPEMYDLLKRIKGMLEFCELEDKIDVATEHEIGALLAKARGEGKA